MKKIIHYINLTAGIEQIPALSLEDDIRFVRIQSSQLESRCFEKMMMGIDNDFLMSLALGHKCIFYDCSAHKKESRAIFQGLVFLRFVLEKRWFGIMPDSIKLKGNVDSTKYFYVVENGLSVDAKRKIDYFKKFLFTKELDLESRCQTTENDSDNDFYRNILEDFIESGERIPQEI